MYDLIKRSRFAKAKVKKKKRIGINRGIGRTIKIKNIYISAHPYSNLPMNIATIFSKTRAQNFVQFFSIYSIIFHTFSQFLRTSQHLLPRQTNRINQDQIRIRESEEKEKFHGIRAMKLRRGPSRNSSAKTWHGISRVYNMYSSCRLRTLKRQANRQVFEKDSSTNTDMHRFAPVTSCTRKQTIPSAGKRLVLLYSFGARATSERSTAAAILPRIPELL